MHKDTGHKIYTGSGRQGGEPYVLFGGSSMAPCAWCWFEIRSGARLGTWPSFIKSRGRFLVGYKAGVLVGLQGNSSRSPSSSFLAWVPGEYAQQTPEHIVVECSSSSSLEASASSS
jgi:hypothetical protein